jgi:hypothetical protein
MSTVAVRAAGLTKRYGGMRALDGLDLEVGVGEVHAVVAEPDGRGDHRPARPAARRYQRQPPTRNCCCSMSRRQAWIR